MSCGVGCRCSSDLVLLWLWHKPAAAALIRPLAWEPHIPQVQPLKPAKKKKRFPDSSPLNVFLQRCWWLGRGRRECALTSWVDSLWTCLPWVTCILPSFAVTLLSLDVGWHSLTGLAWGSDPVWDYEIVLSPQETLNNKNYSSDGWWHRWVGKCSFLTTVLKNKYFFCLFSQTWCYLEHLNYKPFKNAQR